MQSLLVLLPLLEGFDARSLLEIGVASHQLVGWLEEQVLNVVETAYYRLGKRAVLVEEVSEHEGENLGIVF